MRTSVYTFLLSMALILTPCAFVEAGTDDSGLQVFTVDFSKQLGESADVAQEDTLLSPYCYNMFSSGNGLTTLPEPFGDGYEYLGAASDIVNYPGIPQYAFLREDGASTSSIYFVTNPEFAPPASNKTLISTYGYKSDICNMDVYDAMDTTYVTIGTTMLSYVSGTTAAISIPAAPLKTSAIFQNRFFMSAGGSLLYYSAAQNYEDFTATPTTGGVINLFESAGIEKLIATKYGLYIFDKTGIFLLSGSNKNSWQIDKISNLKISNLKSATVYRDVVYFTTISNDINYGAVWGISGIDIQPISNIPGYFFLNYSYNHYLQIINNGAFLVLAIPTVNGTSLILDLNKKTWIRNTEFNGLGSDKYYIKRTSTGYKIYQYPQLQKFSSLYYNPKANYAVPLYPWAYQTSWLTLDGNSGNRKEIDRIEFDYQGGTTSVYLYYAYGNGSLTYSSTTLTAPVNMRMTTYTWNAPIGRQQSNRFYLYFLSSGAQTMTTNYILKQARIYYRNIGNYKTNSLR